MNSDLFGFLPFWFLVFKGESVSLAVWFDDYIKTGSAPSAACILLNWCLSMIRGQPIPPMVAFSINSSLELLLKDEIEPLRVSGFRSMQACSSIAFRSSDSNEEELLGLEIAILVGFRVLLADLDLDILGDDLFLEDVTSFYFGIGANF